MNKILWVTLILMTIHAFAYQLKDLGLSDDYIAQNESQTAVPAVLA